MKTKSLFIILYLFIYTNSYSQRVRLDNLNYSPKNNFLINDTIIDQKIYNSIYYLNGSFYDFLFNINISEKHITIQDNCIKFIYNKKNKKVKINSFYKNCIKDNYKISFSLLNKDYCYIEYYQSLSSHVKYFNFILYKNIFKYCIINGEMFLI